MNTLVIVLIAAVVLVAAYVFYGRWLANKWGIDPKAETPAVKFKDGKDYVPTNGWTVFSHQFSSIAGAGPVTGAIQAAAFGWLPVLLLGFCGFYATGGGFLRTFPPVLKFRNRRFVRAISLVVSRGREIRRAGYRRRHDARMLGEKHCYPRFEFGDILRLLVLGDVRQIVQ